MVGSLRIYYSCNQYPTYYIDAWCSRWDEDNYNVVAELPMPSGDRDTLFRYITPGAYRELYKILGTPYYIDTSYASSNTLRLQPLDGYGLSSLREERIVAVRSAQDTFLNNEIFNIKLEGVRIDL